MNRFYLPYFLIYKVIIMIFRHKEIFLNRRSILIIVFWFWPIDETYYFLSKNINNVETGKSVELFWKMSMSNVRMSNRIYGLSIGPLLCRNQSQIVQKQSEKGVLPENIQW